MTGRILDEAVIRDLAAAPATEYVIEARDVWKRYGANEVLQFAFDADSGVYTQRHVGTAPAVGTLATIRRSTSGLLGKVNINSAADIQTMLANSDQVCQQ